MLFLFTPRMESTAAVVVGPPSDDGDAIAEIEIRRRRRHGPKGTPYGKSFTISLRPDRKEIETIEIPSEIEVDLNALAEKSREELKAKLYQSILRDLQEKIQDEKVLQINKRKFLELWKRIKEERELEDWLIILLLEED